MLKFDGSVYSQGKGTRYEYGTGENTDNVDFRAGTAEMENRVMAIAAGNENVMAITYALAQDITVDTDVTGSVWVWGANKNGEFGEMKLDVTKPTKLAEISNAVLIGGGKSLYIVDSNGTPIMGGLASSGQLGVGGLSSDVYTLSGKSNVVRTDGQLSLIHI